MLGVTLRTIGAARGGLTTGQDGARQRYQRMDNDMYQWHWCDLFNWYKGTLLTESRIACVCGASVICVDIIMRLIPRYRNFEIANSDTFLSASLSLSFGVMVLMDHLSVGFAQLT